MQMLTKSKYLLGLQCPKLLWISVNDKQRIPKPDAGKQAIFDQGHMVGNYAKVLYPGGIDLSNLDFNENISQTRMNIMQKKTIFEAGIMKNNLYSRVDILVPNDYAWDIIEVKSSTRVKDINLADVAFQKHCLEIAGIKVNRCYLMHLNNKYKKDGDIEPKKLFQKTDITESVEIAGMHIADHVKKMLEIISAPEPPVKIGPFCTDPYTCDMFDSCWDLPEHNVFELSRNRQLSFELFNQGIVRLSDIPDNILLSANQKIQLEVEKTKRPYVNQPKLDMFLKRIHEPVSFLDFETYMEAIPVFDGTHPYETIPFQYSLHIQDAGKLLHHEFLGENDPRKRLLESLKRALPKKGSILAYYATYEIMQLKNLARHFPEYETWVQSVIPRFVDLIEPFRQFYVYFSDQHGSASLKSVLPAITGYDYSDLEIQKGDDASRLYKSLSSMNTQEKENTRNALLAYCERDTLAMVWILKKLQA